MVELPHWDGQTGQLTEEVSLRVPFTWATRNQMLPVHEEGATVWVATSRPRCSAALEELALLLKRPLKALLCSPELLQEQLELRYRTSSQLATEQGDKHSAQTEEFQDLLDSGDDSPAVRFLNAMLVEAIREGVSDVHFDPTERGLRVRFRIDGLLQERHVTPVDFIGPLITRLKVLAKLDIAEHRLPQDGRIRVKVAGKDSDFRVSSMPCLGGERIVMRLLDKGHVTLGLNHLNMPPRVLQGMRRCLHRSEGMLLVTGPTGSGKTTTLYSAVQDLVTPQKNIMTIEDPIEVRLAGIAQIQVQPKIGFGFAEGLRHILRQDPDIVLVGEIRDTETAAIAVQAALTGHLVLSTLHTNDAPSAIARLVELGVESYLVASALQGVLAQRLVRVICPHCKQEQQMTDEQHQEWALPKQSYYHGSGCSHCSGSGYQGRVGIYEWLSVNERMQQQILINQDSVRLRHLAQEMGMESLRQHGLRLCDAGITSAEELARVTSPEES